MARPTLSRVLYLQQLGRGLRRTPSKRNAFVNDVVDEYDTMAAPCSLHPVFQNPYSPPASEDREALGWAKDNRTPANMLHISRDYIPSAIMLL